MQVDGRCLCGYLTYEAEVDPGTTLVCHCTDCQVLSGSAFRVSVVVIGDFFKFRSGVPKTFVKTAASGSRRVLAFCPECGTSVYSKPEEGETGYFGLRVGSLRQSAVLVPLGQYWCKSAQSWTDHLADLPKYHAE